MGRLFLVRHAQASFLSLNYDQLSRLGEMQARLLGEHWARRCVAFDRVATGPAVRHRRTAQIVAEAYRTMGRNFPELTVAKEFDEFQGDVVLCKSLPQLLAHNKTIQALHVAMQKASSNADKRAAFQRLFEAVIALWVNGEIVTHDAEPWQEFCMRVNRGLSEFLAKSRKGGIALLCTSGGPLGVAVQRALHLSPQDTLQVAWMSRNCSYSEFLFSGDRFALSSFNSCPHLSDDSLLTYR